MNRTNQQQGKMVENDTLALAAELFDHFSSATTMRQILGLYRNMCDTIGLRPGPLNEFYPKLKTKVKSWKAQALWKKFDARALHRVYNKGTACSGTRVLVIGAGPCGLRTAIEAQLLGAKVVVVEKRDRISRNNVLHLWPFLITDLRNLGAKKFYGKFCAGSIDHISIRQLQCILLKVALLLGVEVHEGISFIKTVEPKDGCGWRAEISPEDHAVSHYEFDVLIGADGKRNTLEGFRRKEFRGKLAIAITANFINKKTEAEAKVEEISGVAFIFNQSFFKELYQTTGIDLENIVYYKDETHYFVMTAKKHSLIDKGVIVQDYTDPAELLAPVNVNTERLLDYAKEAAAFSTKYQMPNLEFAVNHYGKPDVAMFDFTSMFASETSSLVLVRKNFRLLQCLVGDSLLEPFWPTGSGCARGFLSSMDAAYAIKLWSNQRNSILAVLAQRESIYRLLAQTTPENLHRDIGAYTLDPATRYPNLNRSAVTVYQVKHLLNSDDLTLMEQVFMDSNAIQSIPEQPLRRKRRTADTLPLSTVLLRWIQAQLHEQTFSHNLKNVTECFTSGQVLCALINRYRPDLVDLNALKGCSVKECNEIAFTIIEKELRIPRVMSAKESVTLDNIDSKVYLNYLEQVCELFRGEIPHVKHPKLDIAELKLSENKAPDFSRLLKYTSANKVKSPSRDIEMLPAHNRGGNIAEERSRRSRKIPNENHASASDIPGRRSRKRRSQDKFGNIDRERGILSAMPRNGPDDQFSDRIKSMEQRIANKNLTMADKKPRDLLRAIGKIESSDWNIREIEKKIEQSRKTEIGKTREKVPKWSKEQFIQRQNKMAHPSDMTDEKYKDIDQTIKNLDKQLKEGTVLERGERGKNKVASLAGNFGKQEEKKPIQKSNSKVGLVFNSYGESEICHFCKQKVYLMEKVSTEGLILHRSCLKCHHCHTSLRLNGYAFDRDDPEGHFYCTQHYRLPAKILRPATKRSLPKLKPKSESDAQHENQIYDRDTVQQPQAKSRREAISNLDLLDRGQTPERIEFENADAMSDGEPSLQHVIDENEWTDRNFGTGTDESESELSSSDESETESDSDLYEEALGSPLGAQTLQLATDWIGKQRYSSNQYSDDEDNDNDFYDSSEEDEVDSQTEGEELEKARKIRMQEVKLKPLPYLPTDTETEVQTDSESSSPAPEMNSATEISTDSEFEHDPIVKDAPQIIIDETHLRKPTRVQVKQGIIENGKRTSPTKLIHHHHPSSLKNQQIHLEFKPLVQVDPSVLSTNRVPMKNPRPGDYLLSKTASTEGIASKKSLELKKRYLLGETNVPGGLMKSDSTSVLDSKFKNFHSNISECQKLLNLATVVAPSKIPILQNSPLATTKLNDTNTTALPTIITESTRLNNGKSTQVDSEEKENVYGDVVVTKNKLNMSESVLESNKKLSNQRNTTDDIPSLPNIIETIDLVTPEKEIGTCRMNNEHTKFNKNIDFGCEIIDLTEELAEYEVPLNENKKSAENDDIEIISMAERSKNTIDSMLKRTELKKSKSVEYDIIQPPRSPAHETSIAVPHIPWKTKSKSVDLESDSLSSSTTSSVDDIPHYILDSTTSPDTLPGDRFVPRLEIRDTSGELMQIDSLMIIDGKYVGDPEDLKHMQMPDGLDNVPATVESINTETNNREPKVTFDKNCDIPTENTVKSIVPSLPSYKYESSSNNRRRPDLKFDTKNENKIDTLKNMPFIVGASLPNKQDAKQPVKPSILELNEPNNQQMELMDNDKTPTATTPQQCMMTLSADVIMSDSETEVTGPVLTETELSDWNADDAVSENFVDSEFVLNSNKGTIRRNKKKKKNANLIHQAMVRNAVEITEELKCPLAKDLDFEGIEFMDTGSEDSCLETYSATNKALLKNRGYVKFVENNYAKNDILLSYKSDAGYGSSIKEFSEKSPKSMNVHETVNTEISGIDYIEQGACILNSSANDLDLKTPMNEPPPSIFGIKNPAQTDQQPDSLNDIDEDSLVMIASQGTTTATTTTTTTEDSDALTIVTSPVDSATPKNNETQSSEKMSSGTSPPKDMSVTNSTSQTDNANLDNQMNHYQTNANHDEFDDEPNLNFTPSNTNRLKDLLDECSYSDYVRKLQQKITKISNARDSIDVRKTKRKQSKGDISSGEQLNSVIDNNKSLSIYVNKSATTVLSDDESLPALLSPLLLPKSTASVTERIEKISKERTKQKDLIHDLVMDKLQSKKQLNAEKRLNRSRNRNMIIGSPLCSSSTVSTPPNSVSNIDGQRNLASNGDVTYAMSQCHSKERRNSTKHTEQDRTPQLPSKHNFVTASIKINNNAVGIGGKSKDRPLSDHLERIAISETPKILKTQSFCVFPAHRNVLTKSDLLNRFDNTNGFTTPIPPPRGRKSDDSPPIVAYTETERMKQDARARARLKSNQDLGLSPDEKMQLLRKRFHLDSLEFDAINNKSDDMKVRERKMMASKSVNDIRAGIGGFSSGIVGGSGQDNMIIMTDEQQMSGGLRRSTKKSKNDFVSDPNLTEPEQRKKRNNNNNTGGGGGRQKDPERRKSIIKAVSDFFYKKKDKDSSSPTGVKSEKSSDGVFGLFRISPKGKSKSCFDLRNFGFDDKDEILPQYERSKSENCLKVELPNSNYMQTTKRLIDEIAPPIPPLPINYQRSDDESCSPNNETRDQRKLRAISKASRQAELKRLRIAQEIQREQEEIEVKLKDLEARGVSIEKALRGEGQNIEDLMPNNSLANDDTLLKELLEIWRNITQLKKRDDELGIRQQELKLEHRHAQLKEQLNTRLSCSKLDKSSSDVAAEGAILNEMLEIVAKRATLRPSDTIQQQRSTNDAIESDVSAILDAINGTGCNNTSNRCSNNNNLSIIFRTAHIVLVFCFYIFIACILYCYN